MPHYLFFVLIRGYHRPYKISDEKFGSKTGSEAKAGFYCPKEKEAKAGLEPTEIARALKVVRAIDRPKQTHIILARLLLLTK